MNGAQVTAAPGKCRYCGKIIRRKDNLRRHELQTCQKNRILCKCGKEIRKSSLSRHLNKYDCLKSSMEMPNVNNTNLSEPNTQNTRSYKIETELHVTTTENGTIIYKHDLISIDGCQMMLVPASTFNSTEIPEYSFNSMCFDIGKLL